MSILNQGIKYLMDYNNINKKIGTDFNSFRALMNITMPVDLSEDFYKIQDEIIKEEYKKRKIIDINELKPLKNNIYLYLGDITLIRACAIVNACNSKLLGCFHPLHKCIDNAIHSYAGLEVRRDLMYEMAKQGYDEPNGMCKITKGYNLPSKYIFHTVGPIVNNEPSKQNEIDLYNCYYQCLKKAMEMNLENIVFCSISTGLYGYPIEKASRVALKSVNEFFINNPNASIKKVVFNVFTESDYYVYKRAIEEFN